VSGLQLRTADCSCTCAHRATAPSDGLRREIDRSIDRGQMIIVPRRRPLRRRRRRRRRRWGHLAGGSSDDGGGQIGGTDCDDVLGGVRRRRPKTPSASAISARRRRRSAAAANFFFFYFASFVSLLLFGTAKAAGTAAAPTENDVDDVRGQKYPSSSAFGGCLILKDDNHWLVEVRCIGTCYSVPAVSCGTTSG